MFYTYDSAKWRVQTRSEENGLFFHSSLNDAIDAAKMDKSIWKISFTLPTRERIRLMRDDRDDRGDWIYSPLSYKATVAAK